jgi:hypothetical protein
LDIRNLPYLEDDGFKEGIKFLDSAGQVYSFMLLVAFASLFLSSYITKSLKTI